MKDAITKQLDLGNIVLLSNLGFTASGDVLNCSTYDIGLYAAVSDREREREREVWCCF